MVAASVETRALDVARHAADDQMNFIEITRQVLVGLAQIPAVSELRRSCSSQLAAMLKQYTFYTNLGVAGPDGTGLCSAVPSTQPTNYSDRAWFQRVFQTRDFAVGEYQIGRASGKPALGIGYPLQNEEGDLRVIFAGLDVSWLNQLAAGAQLPPGSTFTLTDGNGIILARYPDPENWVSRPMPDAALIKAALGRGGEGTAAVAGHDGVDRVYAIMPLADASSWKAYVMVGIPTQVAYAEVDLAMFRNIAGLLAVGVLGLLGTWFGGDYLILRRVNALLAATKRLASGDIGSRTGMAYGRDEISRLARAFDDMAETIKTRRAEVLETSEALRKGEEQYRALFEGNPHPMWVYDLDTLSFLAVNDAAIRRYGYTRDEFLAMTIADIRPREDVPHLLERVAELRAGDGSSGLSSEEGWRHRKKDGSIIDVEITSHSTVFAGRRAEILLAHDVTERKRAQLGYQTILRTAIDGFWVVDLQGRFQEANDAYCRMTGYTRDELLKMSIPDIEATHGRETVFRRINEITRRGSDRFETRHRRKDGSLVDVEVSVNDMEGAGRHFVFVRDITDRRRAEEALSDSEERYRSLVELSPDAIFIQSEGQMVFTNQGGIKLLGAESADQIIGKPAIDFVHPDDKEIVRERMRQTLKGGARFSVEEKLLRVDGGSVEVEVAAMPFSYRGKPAAQVVVHDISERKRNEERIQRHLQQLTALREIDMLIASSLDLRFTLNVLLDQVIAQLKVDAASVLLFNQQTQRLEYAAGRGFRTQALQHTHLQLGEGYAGKAALERRIVNVPNVAMDAGDLTRAPLLAGELFIAYHAAPLVAKGQVKGVLEVFHRSPLEADPEWVNFLEVLAGQTAIAVDNASLFEDLQHSNAELTMAYDATLEGWVGALDLRHKETEGHTLRVTEMAVRLAQAVGLADSELVHVRRGALLHDIGKTGVPDSILLKPGPLSEEEWMTMRRHPAYAREFLSRIAFLRPALDIPHCHHEKWDGTGYPRGLRGEDIPLGARIFAIVDVWDALRSDRVYRPAWPEEKVREHLRSLSGSHFDPQVVEAFLQMLQTGET